MLACACRESRSILLPVRPQTNVIGLQVVLITSASRSAHDLSGRRGNSPLCIPRPSSYRLTFEQGCSPTLFPHPPDADTRTARLPSPEPSLRVAADSESSLPELWLNVSAMVRIMLTNRLRPHHCVPYGPELFACLATSPAVAALLHPASPQTPIRCLFCSTKPPKLLAEPLPRKGSELLRA